MPVRQVERREAVDNCYGRERNGRGDAHGPKVSSAYMLVYIREHEARRIMTDVGAQDIPADLAARLDEETNSRERGSCARFYMSSFCANVPHLAKCAIQSCGNANERSSF